MSGRVTLLMAIHCHQPVGNFGFVFEEAYAKAYNPFLRVLERHPAIRLALHYSGPLLEWLSKERPAFLARIRALVTQGQIELLASGYYEPILPLLPESDRQGQLRMMQEALRRHFSVTASGAWLTERVWEPELPLSLADAGIRYTMIDTNQFQTAKAWLPGALQRYEESYWDLLGCYTTEYAGSTIVVFPASKRLRYWMPFRPVHETIEFLRRLQEQGPVVITFADDGEKFGLWPKTYGWVYEEGWLDQFFEALERERDWLSVETFGEYLQRATPDGRVYLPCGSYEEMLEWSGGHFRNFFTKYPEANAMYQKMLRVSQQLQDVERSRRNSQLLSQARQELYAGQCNCAYWHGVFGGLYLSHLRRAVYRHLIGAEALTHRLQGSRAGVTSADMDGDGCDELQLKTADMGVVVDPQDGGAITEWNVYPARINLLDTLTRRQEPYHDKLKAHQSVTATAAAGATPASIHDLLGAKEEHLEARVIYDDHRRSAFLDYGFHTMPTLHDAVRSTWGEHRLWSPGPYQRETRHSAVRRGRGVDLVLVRELSGGRLQKEVHLATARPRCECRYTVENLTVPVVALEFNLSLRDERYLSMAQEHHGLTQFTIAEPDARVALTLTMDPPATLYHFPIETISESEEGLERTYQGLALVCLWALDGRRRWQSTLRWDVESS